MQLNPHNVSLARGAHNSAEEGQCTLEVVAMLAGEEHSDQPKCCCPAVGSFCFRWNDDLRDDERTELLLPLTTRLVDSIQGEQISRRRAILAIDWLLRTATPAWLEALPDRRMLGRVLRQATPLLAQGGVEQGNFLVSRVTLALPRIIVSPESRALASEAVARSGATAAWVDLPCLGVDMPAFAAVAIPALSLSVTCAALLIEDGGDPEPVVQQLQASGLALVDRMLAMR
tara:strand:- start:2936 stop:3625 length:690 start_codon:yes stop_codon:yes gene_type:complete